MPSSLIDNVEIARRTMVLFFLVDTSGCMHGSKIGEVNSAFEEIIPELKDLSKSNTDTQIKIAVLEFSTGARWITSSGPIEVEKFVWNDLSSGGARDLGDAFFKLNEKLSIEEFMQSTGGSFAPVIFLLSDGEPTDFYKKGLDLLWQNNWFKAATKVAVAIGDDVDQSILEEFTGKSESVIEVNSAAMVRKMIRFVIVRVTASMFTVGATCPNVIYRQDIFIDELKKFKFEAADCADTDDVDDMW